MTGYFFDGVLTPDGEYDRAYMAADHANYYNGFFSNGLLMGLDSDACKVTASGTAIKTLHVAAGRIFVEGYQGITDGTDAIPVAELTNGYYRLIIRLDRNEDVRAFSCEMVFGTATAFPALVREGNIYDMCLANVIMTDGVPAVEDTRGDAELCGIGRLIQLLLFTATIDTTWSGSSAPFTKTVAVPGILPVDSPVVDIVQTGTWDIDKAMRDDWGKITRITTAADSITLTADTKTKAAINIQLKVVR